MKEFVLKDSRSDGVIRLSSLARTPNGEEHFCFTASFEGIGASVACRVDDYYLQRWDKFFSEAAENWRGWSGVKACRSTNEGFSISLVADSLGHIEMRVMLSSQALPSSWSFTATLMSEAGQLEKIANDARAFFA